MCVRTSVCVYLVSGLKLLRLSSCRVPQELLCSAYYITELQRTKFVKNEANFRRELLFQPAGSHACISFSHSARFFLSTQSLNPSCTFCRSQTCFFTFTSFIVCFKSCFCWSLKMLYCLISDAPPNFSVWALSPPSHGCFLLLSHSSSFLPHSLCPVSSLLNLHPLSSSSAYIPFSFLSFPSHFLSTFCTLHPLCALISALPRLPRCVHSSPHLLLVSGRLILNVHRLSAAGQTAAVLW